MPSNLQLYFKEHHHRWFSVNIFMWKYFFIALFYANMYSQMFYKIDVPEIPENSQEIEFTRPSLLWHRYFSENLLKFLGTSFLQNNSERVLLISIPSFYCFKTFCFRTNQYLYNIPSYFRVHRNSWTPAQWVPILFLHRINAIEVKMTLVFKTFMVFIS